MPISNKRRAKAAEKYCQEVYVKQNLAYSWTDALKYTGYGERYIHSFGAKIWQSMAVKEVITAYQAKSEESAEKAVDYIRHEHQRLQRLAEDKKDLTNATANAVWYGKTYGVYKDRRITEELPVKQLPEAVEAEYKAMAERLKLKIAAG